MWGKKMWGKKWMVLLGMSYSLVALAQDAQEGRLLRFPDIYKDKVVFVYGGDLWLAPTSGGIARRITAHPGRELFPKFSPDGKWIAFTGQYDGNFNVYVMSSGRIIAPGAVGEITADPAVVDAYLGDSGALAPIEASR